MERSRYGAGADADAQRPLKVARLVGGGLHVVRAAAPGREENCLAKESSATGIALSTPSRVRGQAKLAQGSLG
jgi:hypothetical protein